VRISERIEADRRQQQVLARVSRATWRLDQAERERRWALASAHAEGISIRTLATAAGLSASRVHRLVVAADCDALDAALGELRAAGWSAPEDPDFGEDAELDGRDTIADRLSDEVGWLRRCADWLAQLDAGGYSPGGHLAPGLRLARHRPRCRRPCAGARGPAPHRGRPGRTRPRPAGSGPEHRSHAASS
jgi:hypothetical protein